MVRLERGVLTEEVLSQALAKVKHLDPAGIGRETRLVEDLGMDSLDRVEALFELEQALGIEIPDGDVIGLATVGEVVEYLRRREGGENGGAEEGTGVRGEGNGEVEHRGKGGLP
ncbi:MAG: hypothetical protein HZA23_03920 [Nitrospirae bacterium]|nr:hypothetical protein [Nitrospirota bacterium]